MPLDPNKFTRKTSEALQAAQSLARDRNHTQVTPEHLLAALLGQPESVVLPVLERLGVAPKTVRDRVDEALGALPQVYGQTTQHAQLSPDAYQVLEAADAQRADLGDDYLSTEHVLLAMSRSGAGGVGDLLRGLGCHARRAARRAQGRAGQPPGHEREPRGPVPGARALRARPHRRGAQGQARPGHRARRGDPARHPGAVAPDEEQPRAHRRAGRRQDRDRRGPRAAHRRGRRARGPARQAPHRARHRCDGRGREVPRRVRGPAEGGAQGDRRLRRRGHHLRRRAAHDRRRGRRRGRGRCRQHDQADAGPRRAAHDRRHDARRVPQVRREGRRARAPLPAGATWASRRSTTPSPSCAA